MKRAFENVDDVPRYAAVKDACCDEIEIVEFSDSLREKCYEQFKDYDDIDQEELVELLGLDIDSGMVLFANALIKIF